MLSRMAPSSPPDMRTLHLLRTPDILCANDTRTAANYYLVPSCLAIYKMVHFVEREARMQQRLSEQNAGPSIGFQRRVAQISINHKDWVARVSTLRPGKARKLQSGNITPDKS